MKEVQIQFNTASIVGRVTDAETGLPIRAARIEIISGADTFEITRTAKMQQVPTKVWQQLTTRLDLAISRDDGSYRFLNLPDGSYHLKCSLKPPTIYQTLETKGVEVAETLLPVTNFVLPRK